MAYRSPASAGRNAIGLVLCWLCLALLSAGSGLASGPEEDRYPLLFEREGLGWRIDEVVAQVHAAARTYGATLTPGRAQALRQGLAQAFDREALQADFLARFRREVGRGTLRLLLEFYEGSVLGRKVAQLHELAATPQAAADIEGLAARLERSIQDPSRLELLRRLDKATQATDMLLVEMTGTCAAVALGMDALRPLDEQLGSKAIERHYFGYRSKLREAAANRMLAALLYTYRPLSAEELEAYVRFREGSGPRIYAGKAVQMLNAALEAAAERAASLSVEALKAQALALAKAEASSRESGKNGRVAKQGTGQGSARPERPPARNPSPSPRGAPHPRAPDPARPRGAAPIIQVPPQPPLGAASKGAAP